MKKVKEYATVFFILLIILIIGKFYYQSNVNRLLKTGNNSNGTILKLSTSHKGWDRFVYQYKVNNFYYNTSVSTNFQSNNKQILRYKKSPSSLIGYKFRVYYDPTEPENNYMDFNKFLGIDSVYRDYFFAKNAMGNSKAIEQELKNYGKETNAIITECKYLQNKKNHTIKYFFTTNNEEIKDSLMTYLEGGCASNGMKISSSVPITYSVRNPKLHKIGLFYKQPYGD